MKKGEKLKCLYTIDNLFGEPLFKKDHIYDILYVDHESREVLVCLNHILYSNEYNSFKLEWVNKNFIKV